MDRSNITQFAHSRSSRPQDGSPGVSLEDDPMTMLMTPAKKNDEAYARRVFDPGLAEDVPYRPGGRGHAWKNALLSRTERKVAAIELVMPSGNPVLVIRPNLLVMYRSGVFPNALTPLIEKLLTNAMSGGEDKTESFIQQKFEENAAEAYQKFMELLDYVWMTAVIDPVFVIDPANPPEMSVRRLERLPEEEREFIPLYDNNGDSLISLEDKLYLFNWAQGVDEDIATFRERQAIRMATLAEEQGVADNPGGNSGVESNLG